MKVGTKKTRVRGLGLPGRQTAWSYGHKFWVNTTVWRTDRRTDRHAL